jgi:hypothetical protein
VSLPEERLIEEPYVRYRAAVRLLGYLRWAREAFLGRAVHDASWNDRVAELIRAAV